MCRNTKNEVMRTDFYEYTANEQSTSFIVRIKNVDSTVVSCNLEDTELNDYSLHMRVDALVGFSSSVISVVLEAIDKADLIQKQAQFKKDSLWKITGTMRIGADTLYAKSIDSVPVAFYWRAKIISLEKRLEGRIKNV